MMDWDNHDESPPYADPAIRMEYEAAVGRLILAHNEVDFRLGEALKRISEHLAPNGSLAWIAQGTFDTRLKNLELFQKASLDVRTGNVDLSKLKELNEVRNKVAHGHFDQDPFDGSFTIVSGGMGKPRQRVFSADDLNRHSAALKEIAGNLFIHEILGSRLGVTVPFPPSA